MYKYKVANNILFCIFHSLRTGNVLLHRTGYKSGEIDIYECCSWKECQRNVYYFRKGQKL